MPVVETLTPLASPFILNVMLKEVDPNFFTNEELNKPLPSNHVVVKDVSSREFLKQLHQLKCVLASIERYYRLTTGRRLPEDELPNLVHLATDKLDSELVKLVKLIMVIAVICEDRKEVFINRIQQLEPDVQTTIMHIIGPVLAEEFGDVESPSLSPGECAEDDGMQSTVKREIALEEEIARLLSERENGELLRNQINELKARNEQLQERLDKEDELGEASATTAATTTTTTTSDMSKPNAVDRPELENYIIELEAQVRDLQSKTDQDELTIRQLSESLTKSSDSHTAELQALKDKLQESEHVCQRLQNVEKVADRYKRKLQDQSELEHQIETLEQENSKLRSKLTNIHGHTDKDNSNDYDDDDDIAVKLHKAQQKLSALETNARKAQSLADERQQRIQTLQTQLENLSNTEDIPLQTIKNANAINNNPHLVEHQPEVDEIKGLLFDADENYDALISNYTQLTLDKKRLQQSVQNLTTELELISGAWYSLASRIQQQNVAVTKKIYQSPKGWLSKQRQALDRIF